MRLLGLDFGAKRVGMALGDTESRIASPWGVLSNEGIDSLLEGIRQVVARDFVEAIVVGIPRPLGDASQENAQVKEVREFISRLAELDVPIHEEDEALSSRLAAVHVQDRGEKGKRDDLAAAAILQTWLDRKS